MEKISLPPAVMVSMDSVTDRNPMPRSSKVGDHVKQMGQGPAEAIESPHYECVADSEVGE